MCRGRLGTVVAGGVCGTAVGAAMVRAGGVCVWGAEGNAVCVGGEKVVGRRVKRWGREGGEAGVGKRAVKCCWLGRWGSGGACCWMVPLVSSSPIPHHCPPDSPDSILSSPPSSPHLSPVPSPLLLLQSRTHPPATACTHGRLVSNPEGCFVNKHVIKLTAGLWLRHMESNSGSMSRLTPYTAIYPVRHQQKSMVGKAGKRGTKYEVARNV